MTTLGELAASIAHEVNQPLAAIVADANASLNWLAAPSPDLDEVREALVAIVKDGHRAADVIQRIRQLATKTGPQKARVDINDVIRDVVPLVAHRGAAAMRCRCGWTWRRRCRPSWVIGSSCSRCSSTS